MSKTDFKIGDKVRIIGNSNNSQNEIGDVGVITDKSSLVFSNNYLLYVVDTGKGKNLELCHTRSYDMEHFVEYEDQWHLNDGKVEIPKDAEVVKSESGSVVAFRKVKQKPWEFGEIFYVGVGLWPEPSRPKSFLHDTYNGIKVVKAIYIRNFTPLSGKPSIFFVVPGFKDALLQMGIESPHIYRL